MAPPAAQTALALAAVAVLYYVHATCMLCGTMTKTGPTTRRSKQTNKPTLANEQMAVTRTTSVPPSSRTVDDALRDVILALDDDKTEELETQLLLGELDELAVSVVRNATSSFKEVSLSIAVSASAASMPRLQTDREARAAERARRREEQHALDMKKQAAARRADQNRELNKRATPEWEKLRARAEKLALARAEKKGVRVQEGQSAITALEDAARKKRHRLELIRRRREEERKIEESEIAADLAGADSTEEDEWLKAARLNGGDASE